METKRSKVTQVAGNGHYDGQYGRMYKFEISFENGDMGQYLSKNQEQNKFVIGAETEYTIESKENNGRTFYTIKPIQNPMGMQRSGGYQKDPETDKRITRMSVLKVAGDLVINGSIQLHSLTNVAQILERYVLTGEDTMAQVYDQAQPKSKKATSGIMQNFREEQIKELEDTDLPF